MSTHPNFIVDREEILKLLNNLLQQQSICCVNLVQNKTRFTCQLLEIQEDNNLVLFSWFEISQNNQALNKNPNLKISVLFNNVFLAFILSDIKPDSYRDAPCFRALIPKKLYYPQRREAIRISTQSENISFKIFESDTKLNIEGKVFDLSSTGMAVIIPSPQRELDRGDSLHHCQINLPTGDTVNFDLIVSFSTPCNKSGDKFKLGGFFKNMSSKHQKRLDHYVATLERAAIREQKQYPTNNIPL